ncbi:aspartate aminotransferase family protein [Kibdelosporangium aridum]|uniref:aspartate aminotransferase family protein n=1 Tax=Kibdelosporangium aridum TaxID=2030 RepID=UPI000B161BBE|nr:aspartate aminotransferase family protein [Kibdelosporangium aridum]
MADTASRETQDIIERYRARTPGSRALLEQARQWLPGGDTRTINHYTPYPTFMEHGRGCRMTDVDGNEYLDFSNNMSATVHGHAHPALVAATAQQTARSTALGAPGRVQVEHARLLCSRVPAMEKVRYCNSGTEATMLAIRTARAFTGRDVIVKIDGGYHGMHDDAQINMFTGMSETPRPQEGLPERFPAARLARGVPLSTLGDVLLLPYNDFVAADELFSRCGQRIACVIVEPMLGAAGCIPAVPGYLGCLRRLTAEYGALLVVDECATFRVGPLHQRHGVTPDLVSLSKVIGGGHPLGAFGGRADIMAVYDPARPGAVYHASAFGGNNLSLAVGIAALTTYGPAEVAELNETGEQLMLDVAATARAAGLRLAVTGVGSLCHLHWGEGPVRDAQDALARRTGLGDLPELLHLELMNRGIFLSRRGVFTLSLPMTREDLHYFTTAVGETLALLKPHIARTLPHLVHDRPVGTAATAV